MIRVLVVDDSSFVRTALRRVLAQCSDCRVIAEASNGSEALDKLARARPDVVTLDIQMPGLDGIETLRRIRALRPDLPVIMMSTHTQEGAHATLDALEAGAVDFIDKSSINLFDLDSLSNKLVAKLRVWRPDAERGGQPHRVSPHTLEKRGPPSEAQRTPALTLAWERFALCVVGASTGGPPALEALVSGLPPDFPVPLVIVQHMPVGFTGPFAERLDALSRVRVREARDGDTLEPGHVLVAPAGTHAIVDRDLTIDLVQPRGELFVPSVDVLMRSAAAIPGRALGVLLTGMGDDGADGMCAIRAADGLTIAESEASCVVFGMPRAAIARGGASHVLPLDEISRMFAAAR